VTVQPKERVFKADNSPEVPGDLNKEAILVQTTMGNETKINRTLEVSLFKLNSSGSLYQIFLSMRDIILALEDFIDCG